MQYEKEYKMYRGLQKPLVMFGLKGDNIGIAGGTFVAVIVCLMVGSNVSILFAIGLALIPAIWGISALRRNFTEGLHRKKKYPGVWVVKQLIKEV